MKAIVAQREQIESLENDKIELNKVISQHESEKQEARELKREFEQLKKQRTDLLDKAEEFREQVQENEKLRHELRHLTEYFKDQQKQIGQHLKTIEEGKAKETELQEFIERLNL